MSPLLPATDQPGAPPAKPARVRPPRKPAAGSLAAAAAAQPSPPPLACPPVPPAGTGLAPQHPTTRRAYRCQCGRPVFFRNSQCLNCKTPLGYDPLLSDLMPLTPARPDASAWRRHGSGPGAPVYLRCSNFSQAAGCNWLLPLPEAQAEGVCLQPLCAACRLNRTIPDQTVPDNRQRWAQLELAKRRLVSQLIALGLPLVPRAEDAAHGLAFDFLAGTPDKPVMTGHTGGVITLNVEEADDVRREQVRAAMREPYRTLLGHFRHEIGHYYWDRLVRDSAWLPHFRALFGDERQDYAAALKTNYDQGPPADWPQRFISAYASTHPWEDWAETWAHYLHMGDTVDTALSLGLKAAEVEVEATPWQRDALWWPDDPGAEAFLDFLNVWVELTAVVNEMARSMGQHDVYPFVLPRAAVAKLQMIRLVVQGATPPTAPPLSPASLGPRP